MYYLAGVFLLPQPAVVFMERMKKNDMEAIKEAGYYVVYNIPLKYALCEEEKGAVYLRKGGFTTTARSERPLLSK